MHLESDVKINKKSEQSSPISSELLYEHQLDFERISIHHSRILQALNKQINTTIPIMGACTTSNGGILSWKQITRILSSTYHPMLRKFQKSSMSYWRNNHLVTCIPAAGAASRFFSDIQKFTIIIENKIPEFKELCEVFNRDKKTKNISFEKRKSIQEILINHKISPELSSLFEQIEDQESPNIKNLCNSFYHFLSEILYKGTSSVIKMDYKISTNKDSTSFFNSENYLRTPWNYSNLNNKIKKYSSSNQNLKNEGNSDHWMERINPQSNIHKKDQIESEKNHIYIGNHEESILKAYAVCKILLNQYGSLPKALVPTTNEGDSFLMLKLSEQIKLLPCLGNVLVVPTNMKKEFENQIQTLTSQIQESTMDIFTLRNSPFAPEWLKNNRKNSGQWFILEQGRALSTIRFNMDGTPFKDEDGKYTPVSAGHGELIHLFDKIADEFPSAECLHIRNIDNVIGTSNDRSDELNVPAEAFRIVRDCIEYLRAKIEDLLFSENKCEISLRIHDKISLQVLDYLSQFIDNNLAQEGLKICYDNKNNFNGIPFQAFHKIIGNLFHWQPLSPSLNEIESWEQTLTWMEQPISIFGVVRKEVADIGGGPIFATLPDGTKIKLCIEMPHSSEEDSNEYFGSRGKSTHFNPVLAFFELRTNKRSFEKENSIGKKVIYSKLFDERFWLLTKREYKGIPVCYHETVLHELIGNSATTNLIFIEVPRTLFRPHKSFFDSLGNDRRSYGFDETLATSETRNF
ncbi:DUF4301 family protein [Silvanigrella paludirubra]|uniref:DUF4301 family protein n=1 Tax=Silvanigrella paludirubra TaxID=2499159 RepID=A0A6N6VXX6_9BACT|nr:DUF4301 family protein [Silvanigrella paludirubra]KAB8040607.1 DUF4301 family protein [Silvanigrella paludirubra]